MLIYWVNLCLVFIWTLGFKIFNKTSSQKLMNILFIQLLLLLVLRDYSVGSDTAAYISLFERINLYPFFNFDISRHEAGYILLNKIIGLFTQNKQIFISVMAFFPLMLFFRFIKKESKIKWLSVVLFITLGFYTNTFNWFRQIIAMALIVNSIEYVKTNQFKKFIGITIIASLFHFTALAFIPIYFIRNIRINIKTITIYAFMGVFIFFFSRPIINIVASLFATYEYTLDSGGGTTFLLILIMILFFSLFFKKNILSVSPEQQVYYHILFFAILFQLLALEFGLVTRVVRYFSIFLIVFIPNTIYYFRDKYITILGLSLVCVLTLLIYYNSLLNDISSITPYKFFFMYR